MRIRRLFVLWILLLSPGIFFAQEPFFRQIILTGTGVGFRINTICQDSSRFMWLATNDGIWKNEGTVFTKLKLPQELDKSNVTAIFPLPVQGIVAGTSSGRLFSIIGDTVSLIDIPEVREPVAISSILVSASDEIWVATLGNGITRIKSGKARQFSTNDGLGDNYVYELIADSSGRIWSGSDGGLSYIEYT